MNTFSEIILWLLIALYTIAALGHVTLVGKDRGIYKPEAAAVNVFLCTSVISGLLFVLWSNR